VKRLTLDEKIALCEEYSELWSNFFNFFADGLEGKKITGDAEAQFFRIMTELARKEFALSYFMESDFTGGDKIITLLNQTVSLMNLQGISEAAFNKIQMDWHIIFISLRKCCGRLIQRRPVKTPAAQAKAAAPAS
jgi:hypothetical protein